jgi:hypothetical protein
MRLLLGVLLITLALWRAAIDWQATIGQGYAYRFASLGTLLQGAWPDGHAHLAVTLQQSGIPWLWHPVGAALLAIPVAPLLAAAGMLVLVRRPRVRAR